MGLSKRVKKLIFIPLGIIVFLALLWMGLAFIGRVGTASLIPGSADLRLTIHHPAGFIDGLLSHESLREIPLVPELAAASPIIDALSDNALLQNSFVRMALSGTMEMALMLREQTIDLIAVLDMGFLSPLLRVMPFISRFINLPGLYHVQSSSGSYFEYRMDGITLYIGHYRNLLYVSNSYSHFTGRGNLPSNTANYNIINPSSYDAALIFSGDLLSSLLAGENDEMSVDDMAILMGNISFNTPVEAGLSIFARKLEFYLAAGLSSGNPNLQRLLEQRASVPDIMERFPGSSQYATVLSAGTLQELLDAAIVFSGPELSDALIQADSMSRNFLRMSLDELLFSWSGNEFAVFGMEGRPHPVYAVQVNDERKRQEVFDRAFRSLVLSENVRLNLDGTRIPQIEIPSFIQTLLRIWGINLPSPYYYVHGNYLLICESAETLLAAMRSIQRNDVLPGTAEWRYLSDTSAGGSAAAAFSLYYSLDVSIPFFLRGNSAIGSFLGIYRQGLASVNIDRGFVSLSLGLIPGPGSGIILVNSIPINTAARPSNRIFGDSHGNNGRIYISAGDTVLSVDMADYSIRELSGQGQQWIVPALGITAASIDGSANAPGTAGAASADLYAWVVSDRGRVNLVDGSMESVRGFPLLTGLRISSPPVAYNGLLYLACEDGRVSAVDASGQISVWDTSFFTALRSPPSFTGIGQGSVSGTQARQDSAIRQDLALRHFAAAYPKGFFGEIWLLDLQGSALSGWPASLITDREGEDYFSFDSGLGFGSPHLFAHNNRLHLAFVSQAGDLFVFDEYASPLRPFPLVLEGVFYQQPVFDGEFLWLVSSDGRLFRVGFDGEILQHAIRGFSVMEEGFLTVFDYDGDGIPEIFVTGEGNALHGFTRHFRSLESFPLPMWGQPYFSTRGARPEIFGMGMDGRLYRWQFR